MVSEKLAFALLNPDVVLKKLLPSVQFSSEEQEDHNGQQNAITVFESVVGQESAKKFQERYEEDYDIESDDLYSVWLKMKALSIQDDRP